MRKVKLSKQFDEIWKKAEKRNAELGATYGFDAAKSPRFHKISSGSLFNDSNNRFVTMGIYDSEKKKYALFDTINLSGNYRYNKNSEPAEFAEMLKLINS